MSKFALIVNPTAGRGSAISAAQQLATSLRGAGHSAAVKLPADVAHAAHEVRTLSASCDRIAAVGGDGTLRLVIDALARPIPVGIVPCGTANVVARELGIRRNLEQNLALLTGDSLRRIDLGEANGQRFLAMVGVGLDARIVAQVAQRRSGPIWMSDYLIPSLRAIAREARAPLRLRIDDQPAAQRFLDLTVCNTRCYGAFFAMTPQANCSDGQLDWVGRYEPGLLSKLRWFLALAGQRRSAVCRYGQAQRLHIDSEAEPVPVQIDGDPAGTTPVRIHILPSAASILAPPAAIDQS